MCNSIFGQRTMVITNERQKEMKCDGVGLVTGFSCCWQRSDEKELSEQPPLYKRNRSLTPEVRRAVQPSRWQKTCLWKETLPNFFFAFILLSSCERGATARESSESQMFVSANSCNNCKENVKNKVGLFTLAPFACQKGIRACWRGRRFNKCRTCICQEKMPQQHPFDSSKFLLECPLQATSLKYHCGKRAQLS